MVKSFRGLLGHYEVIETDDGSKSLYSHAFGEACHSKSGARLETKYIYIDGCELGQRNSNVIFETGFGTGLGLSEVAALNRAYDFFSTELDEDLVLWSQNKFEHFERLSRISLEDLTYYEGQTNQVKSIILIGDARETVAKAKRLNMIGPIDAIFQDAFSPKKSPTLWTVEWFELLKSLCSEKVILSTYSASTSIRRSLLKAGWLVEERKGFSQKRSSTTARLVGDFSTPLMKKLKESKISPLMDISL